MGRLDIRPTDRERFFAEDDLIVSKTDLTGKITYANEIFQQVAGYSEQELVGQAHSIIRHPDMPRAVFAYLWTTIATGQEVFAYVKNMAKTGDYYWVFAHVTPSFDPVSGQITAYHSSRRVPSRRAVTAIEPIYAALLAEERRHADRREGLQASLALLTQTLTQAGLSYPQFVWTLDPTLVA